MINAWSPSPSKRASANRLSNYGSFREVRGDASPDFRITKGTGVQSDLNKKLAAMNSGKDSSERVSRALMSPINNRAGGGQKALRTDSCGHFEEGGMQASGRNNDAVGVSNKMRKLNNARREGEQRHCSNSPFRIDNYGSSSSIGFDSAEGSPMAVSRGYGLRANIKGAAADVNSQ